MPTGPIPLKFIDLLEGNVVAHLATVTASGQPNVNPVWILWDADTIVLSVLDDTRKLANMRANPNVALSLGDPENSARYLEIRGTVTDISRYDDLSVVNVLSRKYTGGDYKHVKPGQVRYRVAIDIRSWSGQS